MAVRHLLLCAGEASFLLRFPRHEMWKGDSSCFFLFATVDANKKPPESQGFKWFSLDGAAIQIRTGDLILTKDALYQLSYSSKWRPGSGSNRRPPAWQAGALTNWATGPWSLKCIVSGGWPPERVLLYLRNAMLSSMNFRKCQKSLGKSDIQGKIQKQNAQSTLCALVAGVVSLELTARGFGDRCSTNWAIPLSICRIRWMLDYYIRFCAECQAWISPFLQKAGDRESFFAKRRRKQVELRLSTLKESGK